MNNKYVYYLLNNYEGDVMHGLNVSSHLWNDESQESIHSIITFEIVFMNVTIIHFVSGTIAQALAFMYSQVLMNPGIIYYIFLYFNIC